VFNFRAPFSKNGIAIVLFAGLTLSACQSTGPTMSVEDARKIAADFKISNFVAPPRTIDVLRQNFKDGRPLPESCEDEWADRKTIVARSLKRLNTAKTKASLDANAANLVVLAEQTVTTGRFDLALNYMETALDSLPNSMHRVRQAIFATQLSRLHARLGNLDSAGRLFGRSIGYWNGASLSGTDWLNNPKGKLYTNAGRAALARLRGELPLAEHHYRYVVDDTRFGGGGSYSHVNVSEMRADLARVILLQGRVMEAEAVAREWISKSRLNSPNSLNYDGDHAALVAVMAAIMIEQGKVKDAEYLARIAVNMHESNCSEPQSLGITEARLIWMNAMAEQGNWTGILEQVNQARSALKDYPNLFKRQFGTSMAYVEAELNAGDADIGRSLAKQLQTAALQEDGPDSFKAAEIEGVLALADSTLGQNSTAIKRFAKVMPTLVGSNETNETVAGGRRERILQGYMDLLVTLAQSDGAQSTGLDIPGELLRLSSARRLGRVQQAVSAGSVRAAAGDPALAKLVRQEQDLTEEARALGEALAYVQSAPSETSKLASDKQLQKRLSAVDLARRTLRKEILNGFPNYAELIAPKPMTVPEIANRLKPDQALIAFHVGRKSTYVWAMPANGKLVFSKIDITRTDIKQKVNQLRKAVDPGLLRTLDDIPAFNVKLANELYATLLKPVEKGWENAQEVLVVADGPLGALPFSMLTLSPEIAANDDGALFERYRGVDWLVNKVAVTNLPSINSLKRSSITRSKDTESPKPKLPTTRRAFVGFGDPFFSAQQALGAKTTEVASRGFTLRAVPQTRSVDSADLALLPRLPDTRDEILSIAQAVGADLNRDVYLGKAASEKTVKSTDLSDYDVISFATHGLVPGDLNGLDEPALALSSPDVTKNKEDGLLTMNEILALKLNAEFAVLSACNTAAADGAGSEAVSGLGRAFFYAGAKALLVSNWPVNSGSTTDLMSKLFKALVNDKTLTRSQALRQTKQHQIMSGGYKTGGKLNFSFAHPIFWAPFTLVGDGGGAVGS
jgi:CHAT domain-containing protein